MCILRYCANSDIDKAFGRRGMDQPTRFQRRNQSSVWQKVPRHLLALPTPFPLSLRAYSTKQWTAVSSPSTQPEFTSSSPKLTHLTPQGNAHMVSISSKI